MKAGTVQQSRWERTAALLFIAAPLQEATLLSRTGRLSLWVLDVLPAAMLRAIRLVQWV